MKTFGYLLSLALFSLLGLVSVQGSDNSNTLHIATDFPDEENQDNNSDRNTVFSEEIEADNFNLEESSDSNSDSDGLSQPGIARFHKDLNRIKLDISQQKLRRP